MVDGGASEPTGPTGDIDEDRAVRLLDLGVEALILNDAKMAVAARNRHRSGPDSGDENPGPAQR